MIDDTNNNENLGNDGYETPEEAYTKSKQAPAVANKPGKNFVFVGGLILVGVIILYSIFSDSDDKKNQNQNSSQKVFLAKTNPIDSAQLAVPPLPPAPPPPPVAIDTKEDATSEIEVTPEEKEEAKKRMQSGMLVSSGGGIFNGVGGVDPATGKNSSLTEINDNDPNVGFADSFYNQKDTPFATARRLGDTGRLITQGKILDAVLETPINTDVPGMIRAVVSRDIYAESGRSILIPKGSRLIGTYNSFVIRGNKRVNVIWSRVIRPDGIDIMIRSAGADQIGTAGIAGEVDNKYLEMFASAFLVSAINIAVGAGADAIDPQDNNSSTTRSDGSETRQNSATNDAALQAVDMFGSAGSKLVEGFINLKPTITVDQGTRINVFVNRDLIFPAGLGSSVKMVQ